MCSDIPDNCTMKDGAIVREKTARDYTREYNIRRRHAPESLCEWCDRIVYSGETIVEQTVHDGADLGKVYCQECINYAASLLKPKEAE